MHKFTIILALSLLGSPLTIAQKTQSTRTGVNSPEQELAGFTVPEGFVVELVAGKTDFIGVDNDYVIASINVWGVFWLMFATQPRRNLRC